MKDNDIQTNIPQAVKACLWSYDTDKIDLSNNDHRQRIIINVLNRGTMDAIEWLKNNFSKQEISESIQKTNVSEWSKKSLSLWSLVYDVYPLKMARFN